ncbi:hypothetical protein StoSoilB13_21740 [Arthrobacter sp. StoSoilB13]|nr:hypothetical protein StoSoilB13_21740 [Arthrobacter sp. StoSoilB13]
MHLFPPWNTGVLHFHRNDCTGGLGREQQLQALLSLVVCGDLGDRVLLRSKLFPQFSQPRTFGRRGEVVKECTLIGGRGWGLQCPGRR